MIVRDTVDLTLRVKTGRGSQDGQDIGWYVGYLQVKKDVYFFATCIQCANPENPDFARARIEITLGILKELRLL
jgi:beta-lactamase class D